MPDRHRIFIDKQGAFVCPVCGNVYKTSHGLQKHFEDNQEHKTAATLLLSIIRVNFFRCQVCGTFGMYSECKPVWCSFDGWIHPTCKEEAAYAQIAKH